MKKLALLPAFFLLLTGAVCAQAQDIAGDWEGTLRPPDIELRLVLHVTKSASGYTAILDSIDQGGKVLVDNIAVKSGEVSFTVDTIHGSYQGKLSADGKEMHGSWTQQGQSLPLDFKHSASPWKTTHAAATPSDIDGAWKSTLNTGQSQLRLLFHLVNTADGLTVTMDSIDQNKTGIPATVVKRDGDTLVIEFKQIAAKFTGKISKDRTAIVGTWAQLGNSFPLSLSR